MKAVEPVKYGRHQGRQTHSKIMQLSDTEKKMVTRLQKQQASLIRWRWAMLLSSAVCLGCGAYIAVILQQLFKPDILAVTILAMASPLEYLMFGIGTWMTVMTILNWNGKPETALLLKLIEVSKEDT